MPSWKHAVARAFDRAEDYESFAAIQVLAATRLAGVVGSQSLPPVPRILEIGCGTGLLTRRLSTALPGAAMVVSDLAPAMVERCRAGGGFAEGTCFLAMDAERPCLLPGFDLVASSLAAQWFEDLPRAFMGLAGLLAPGGLIALTTLAAGTFREWAEAHEGTGSRPSTPTYPTMEALRALQIGGCSVSVSVEPLTETHADGRAFLRSLKAIGAGTPDGANAASPGALRKVLRRFDRAGAAVTYEVATCLIRRL